MGNESANLRKTLMEGVPELEKTLQALSDTELHRVMLDTLDEIGTPTRGALLNYLSNRQGKWDNESLKRAVSHRWWSKRRQKGLPVGFSRVLAVRALAKEGFGYTVRKLKSSTGYLLRLTAWGPGIHLIEKGRGGARGYKGWGGTLSIMRRFEGFALSRLNELVPKKLEEAAARAAAKNGVRQ